MLTGEWGSRAPTPSRPGSCYEPGLCVGCCGEPLPPTPHILCHVSLLFPLPPIRGWQWWRHPSRPPGGYLPANPGAWTSDQWWPCVPSAGCGAHDCGQETSKWFVRLQRAQGLGRPLPPRGKSVSLSWALCPPHLLNGAGGMRSSGVPVHTEWDLCGNASSTLQGIQWGAVSILASFPPFCLSIPSEKPSQSLITKGKNIL